MPGIVRNVGPGYCGPEKLGDHVAGIVLDMRCRAGRSGRPGDAARTSGACRARLPCATIRTGRAGGTRRSRGARWTSCSGRPAVALLASERGEHARLDLRARSDQVAVRRPRGPAAESDREREGRCHIRVGEAAPARWSRAQRVAAVARREHVRETLPAQTLVCDLRATRRMFDVAAGATPPRPAEHPRLHSSRQGPTRRRTATPSESATSNSGRAGADTRQDRRKVERIVPLSDTS